MSSFRNFFQKQIFFPSDHGSWVFLLSPLLIGIFAAKTWSPDLPYLIAGLLAAFFIRQPASIAIKAYSKRRSKQDIPPSLFWILVYSVIGLLAIIRLVMNGFSSLLWLVIPGALVFSWHLWLVSRRSERHQMGVDIIASGALALAAPAAYWLSLGIYSPLGWVLWLLTWLQSASSIVYAFLRLSQRNLTRAPSSKQLVKMGSRALLYSGFNLTTSIILPFIFEIPAFIWLPYLLQFIETLRGVLNPSIGQKPTTIGFRQLGVSSLFTILFILVWYI